VKWIGGSLNSARFLSNRWGPPHPSDNYIRLMLDGASPSSFDGLFIKAIEAAGPLTPFQCLDGRMLIALDGTEHFCSRKDPMRAMLDAAAR
jgi:hypothetical protein